MKRVRLYLLALLLISTQGIFAQAPQGLNYQAIARNSSGAILPNQSISLRITVTDVAVSANYYEETQSATTNQFGLFTINVGNGTPVSGTFSAISWGTITPYLKVEMDPAGGANYTTMGTSQLLSVPYALYAASGNPGTPGTNGTNGATWYTGSGAPPGGLGAVNDLYLNTVNSQYYKKTGASTWTLQGTLSVSGSGGGSLDSAYNFGGAGAGRTITANSGSVQINSSTASASALTVTTTASGTAINATSSSTSSQYPTIQATSASTTSSVAAVIGDVTGGGIAVAGQVEAAGIAGAMPVFGNNLRTTGGVGVEGDGFNGVEGQAYNAQGIGIYGLNNSAASGSRPTNVAVGTYGLGFFGVYGQTQQDNGAAVIGTNLAPTRTGTYSNAGVEGQGFYGVMGTSNSPGVGFAVVASGDLGATGDLIVNGTKSFEIDHPLDPANKFLKHFCLESNEVLNMYRGSVQLDASGEAVVELPAYFASINKNFTYQLTAVGAPAPTLYVKSEIENNTFSIAGGQPNQKVSWEVVAERNDLYLQNHPEQRATEIAKKPGQIGKYCHPLDYGKSEKEGIVVPSKIESVLTTPGGNNAGKQLNLKDGSSNK